MGQNEGSNPASGPSSDSARMEGLSEDPRLGRWALSCFALIILTILYLLARTEFVERWREQDEYRRTVTERLDYLDSAVKAFDRRTPAFFEFATGQFAMIEIDNCFPPLADRRTGSQCGPSIDLNWSLTSPNHASYSYQPLATVEQKEVDALVDRVRDIAPLIRSFVLAQEGEVLAARNALRTALPATLGHYPAITETRLLQFCAALRSLLSDRHGNRRVALWALYDSPPGDLMSLGVQSGGRFASQSFSKMQPGRSRTAITPFKNFVAETLRNSATGDEVVQRITTIRESWLKRVFDGQLPETDAPKLPLAGAQVGLSNLFGLLPLALSGVYAVFCVTYLNWHRSSRPGGLGFPTFGYGMSGLPVVPEEEKPTALGWCIFGALPLGVIGTLIAAVSWPLVQGGGWGFVDEYCTVRWSWTPVSCGDGAWAPIMALAVAAVLTGLVIRTEIATATAARHARLEALALGISSILIMMTLKRALDVTPYELHENAQWWIIHSLNFWLPLFIFIALPVICGIRGFRFAVVALTALYLVLPDSPKNLVRFQDAAQLDEDCFGPACHIE